MNWLSAFPGRDELISLFPDLSVKNVNSHVHTPYSFSAFSQISEIFARANDENITVLGINDFFVTDGYRPFFEQAHAAGIFPLFCIEFIGLMKKEQVDGLRINDPNNPGRCYFCGKGLDYPFHTDGRTGTKLQRIVDLSQDQIRAMLRKLNQVLEPVDPGIQFTYEEIRNEYAVNLVRERHLAKAVRIAVYNRFSDESRRIDFFTRVFGGKLLKSSLSDIPAVENEIRSNLLKSGGSAFVEEDESTFLNIDEIIEIIW